MPRGAGTPRGGFLRRLKESLCTRIIELPGRNVNISLGKMSATMLIVWQQINVRSSSRSTE